MHPALFISIVVLAAASWASSAGATPPALPCDYACLWPIGSHSIPEVAEVGEDYVITYTYAWKAIPENEKVGALTQKEIPPGHYGDDDSGEMLTPPDYVGSAIRLRLPEGIDVLSWSGGELEKKALWVDHYGRTTYEYTGLNAYVTEKATTRAVTIRVQNDASIYPDDEIRIDLGVRGDEWRSPVLFVNIDSSAVKFSDKPARSAAGAADPYAHRDTHVLPDSAVELLNGDDLGGEARQALLSFALGQEGTEDTAYAYGTLRAQNRPPDGVGTGANTQAFSAAADVRVCAHDVTISGTVREEPMTVNGEEACSTTDAGGFFGIVVPRADPDGNGTPADIITVFSLDHERVTVRASHSSPSPISTRSSVPVGADSDIVQLGKHTVPSDALFTAARWMYNDVLDAHRFFSDTLGYDTPHVNVVDGMFGVYVPSLGLLGVNISPDGSDLFSTTDTVFHEFGHHVMESVYPRTPPSPNCSPHRPGVPSSAECAWTEGWANFVSRVIHGNPRALFGGANGSYYDYESRDTYQSPLTGGHDPLSGSHSLSRFSSGLDDEGNITATLWDLHDDGEEAGDNMADRLSDMWAVFRSPPGAGESFPAATVDDFIADWGEAGLPSPHDVLALNEIAVAHTPATLETHIERDGIQKDGAGARHAREGDTIVAQLEVGARIDAAVTPTAAFLDGEAVPMTFDDEDQAWMAEAVVEPGAHEGVAPVTIRAPVPGVKMATASPISHENGSDAVAIKTAYAPAVGTHRAVVSTAITDVGGATVARETAREFSYDPRSPSLVAGGISDDGMEITMYFSEGLDASTVSKTNIMLDSRLTFAEDPISHEDGLDTIRVYLADPPPADGVYTVALSTAIADTEGHSLTPGSEFEFRWNPMPPLLESVGLSADARTLTLTFSEMVDRFERIDPNNPFDGRRFRVDVGSLPISTGQFTTPLDSRTHTISLREPLSQGTHTVEVKYALDDGRYSLLQRKTITHTTRTTPVLNDVAVSDDGRELTLKFNRGIDSREFADREIIVSRAGALNALVYNLDRTTVLSDNIRHEENSDTVRVIMDEPLRDGGYRIIWDYVGLSPSRYLGYEDTQIQYFWWNPAPPRLESYAVAPDGRSIDFTFSEEMNEREFERHARVGSTAVIDDTDAATVSPGSATVTLNLLLPLAVGSHAVVLPPEITDAAGLRTPSGLVAILAWDAAPPSLESAEMSADGRSVRLTFSEGLDGSTVTAESISASAGLALAADNPIAHADGSKTITLNLASEPTAGSHTVTARGTIRDVTGVPMGANRALTFEHVPGAPVFEAASISADGSTVTLEFSEGLDGSTVTADSVRFETRSEATQFTHALEDSPIVVDTAPPRLLDAFFTSPRTVRLELSEPPDPDTVTAAAFALESGGSAVPATPSYIPGEAAITLSLGSDAASATHAVSVKGALTDRAGNPAAESSRTLSPQAAAGAAPSFTAKRANDIMVIVEFSEDMRVKSGGGLDWRDWLFASIRRPTNHYVDLDNRRIVLQFDRASGIPGIGFGEIAYNPLSGGSALEDITGYDLPVGSAASTVTAPRDFPFFFAESTAEGVINVRFDRTVSTVPSTFRIGGTTAASEWSVNGAPATGVRESSTGEAIPSITLDSATGFYLTHSTPGAPETLQVKYTRPASGGNSLTNAAGALETTQVTSVNRIMNAFTGGAFADSRTLELTSTRPADRRVADHLQVEATGDAPPVTLASGSRSPGNPLVEVLRLGAGARDGCTYRVSLLPPVAFVMGIWTPNGGAQGEVTYTDDDAPVILSASTDGTTTSVLFDEPVSLGASPTITQHRGHWTVTERVGGADVTREVSSVAVSAADASTVEITHAALSGTAATPTVSYDGAADDDARIRDTRASPCTETDAAQKNAQDGSLEVTASDGAAPAGAVSASVSDGGVAKSGPNAQWAGIGDTVTVSLAMTEDARGGAAPRLTASGENTPMEMGASGREWSGSRTVAAGDAQDDYAFTVTALDAGANLGVFTQAGARARAMVDTVLPRVDLAETTGPGEVRVTLNEGAWGLLRAADWTVGGERATGASLAGGDPSPAVALAGGDSFTLHVPGPGSTGATPLVVYRPQAPGASPDPAPAPPPAGIALDVGGLDGATVRMGDIREFAVSATAADAHPIVLLEGNPAFVDVLNTGPGAPTVIVDASHASAAAGTYTFTVIATTGSDPARAAVTVTLEPAA